MSDEYIDSIAPMDIGWQTYFDGNYYQPQSPDIVHARRVTNMNFQLHRNIGGMGLRHYQDFVELDWLRPHGQFQTVISMEEHLVGEHREFVHANNQAHSDMRSERVEKLRLDSVDAVVSELGDIWWFMNALCTNGAISVDEAWRQRLRREAPELLQPEHMTLSGVDNLIRAGYFPRMGILEPDEDVAVDLLFAAGFTSIGTKLIYEYHNEHDLHGMRSKQHEVGQWVVHGLGLVTLHAQAMGASLSDVVDENMRKLTMRAARGTLDSRTARKLDEL